MLPEALEAYGRLEHIEFVRQEPKKRKLSDAHLSLDMPILFRFAAGQVLLWLVEFQKDKQRFSIYRLLRYTTYLMESHPQATVIPAVLFTKKRKWKKDVQRRIGSCLGTQQFLRFQYQCIRLFDFQARDCYRSRNPIVKILMPSNRSLPPPPTICNYLNLFRPTLKRRGGVNGYDAENELQT